MIQIIIQCDKCGKAKIKEAQTHHIHEVGHLDKIAGFVKSRTIQYAPGTSWVHLGDDKKMLCPECSDAYRQHIKDVEGKATEEQQRFFG